MSRCSDCGTENPDTLKFCGECGTRLTAPAPRREARRTVTVLFNDVTGSTALGERLDPESLRTVMGLYFAAMKGVIERHGGTVEKFIGDAVMAVFGIPTLHEDDALRAVRAAADMREALEALNRELEAQRGIRISTRTGVNTGEVVAGDPSGGQTLVTGDAVNTAARLEQAAAPGAILLGEPTYRLVRDAVLAEPMPPVDATGKALPVPSYRLISVTGGAEGRMRRADAPLVGRDDELARLGQAFRQAVTGRSCHLFTLLGTAGVGKTRLTAEFLASVSAEAQVLKGRCLPYGEGITYRPLGEVVHSAAGIAESDSPVEALVKFRSLLEGERDADVIVQRVASAIGLSGESAPQEEIFWATRRLLEHLARQFPLVVLWEDIHWAESTFLDLIEHVADLSRDAPLLVLCPARPELLDKRTDWGGGKLNATTMLLEPLPLEATGYLIEALPGGSALPPELRARILGAAEGNPLYLEEMLSMLLEEGLIREQDGWWRAVDELKRVRVPPSIQALLAARIDQMGPEERAIAEHASVVGRVFEQAAVAELASPALRPHVTRALIGLVRKELVRPERSEISAGDAFRFRHILIRDAAYEALPKSERAELHERFADWLQRTRSEREGQYEEIIGHHLEQAYWYRVQLGSPNQAARELARRAAVLLTEAGGRAIERGDYPAAGAMLQRALDLAVLPTAEDLWARASLVDVLLRLATPEEAVTAAEDLVQRAVAAGDRAAEARAQIRLFNIRSWVDASLIDQAGQLTAWIKILEDQEDAAGLALGWKTYADFEGLRLRWGNALVAAERAVIAAERAIDASALRTATAGLMLPLLMSPIPVADGIQRLERLLERAATKLDRALALSVLGPLLLLDGHSEHAHRVFAETIETDQELGLAVLGPQDRLIFAYGLLAVGHTRQAEAVLRDALEAFVASGDMISAPTAASLLVLAVTRNGSHVDDLDRLLVTGQSADGADIAGQAQWRWAVAAAEVARSGDLAKAERVAREAVELLEPTDAPIDQAEAFLVLGEVLSAQGRADEAVASLRTALDLFATKQATAAVARVRRMIVELVGPAQA